MLDKKIEEITAADIQSLQDDGVRENTYLEYKSALPDDVPSSKVKFLAEIVAFANSHGGWMVLGIEDENGMPKAIRSIECKDVDKEKLRLEQIIRNGCEPKILGIQIREIAWDKAYLFVIRIPKSWNSPHLVSLSDNSKFYGRNSAGKYPMDVTELRSAFLGSEEIPRRIRAFRTERIDKLISRHELPGNLFDGSLLVMHLVPLSAFTVTQGFDALDHADKNLYKIKVFGASSSNRRPNLDGLIIFSGPTYSSSKAYTQLYRSGIVESVKSIDTKTTEGNTHLDEYDFEHSLTLGLASCLDYYSSKELMAPHYCFVTLTDMLNAEIMLTSRKLAQRCDRSILMLPELIITDIDMPAKQQLKPCFDMVRNAFGVP